MRTLKKGSLVTLAAHSSHTYKIFCNRSVVESKVSFHCMSKHNSVIPLTFIFNDANTTLILHPCLDYVSNTLLGAAYKQQSKNDVFM